TNCQIDTSPRGVSLVPGPCLSIVPNPKSMLFEIWAHPDYGDPNPHYLGGHADLQDACDMYLWLTRHTIACHEAAGEATGFVQSEYMPGHLEHRHLVTCDNPEHLHLTVLDPGLDQPLPLTTHQPERAN